MRNRYQQINCILNLLGKLLQILSLIILSPLIVIFISWNTTTNHLYMIMPFVIPALGSATLGTLARWYFKSSKLDMAGSMLLCALGWICSSAIGAIPFIISGVTSNWLNAFFESTSGFTTTGITVFSGLDAMPQSILFWRSVTEWFGGIGILSFFLIITFRGGGGAHHMFGAESHKISSGRPKPGLFNTIKILWSICAIFTLLAGTLLWLEGMSPFDAICHALTTGATGGFSTHDANIGHFSAAGYQHFRLIEYTLIILMIMGSINFLIHYRIFTGNPQALWDNIEIRWFWGLLASFTLLVIIDRAHNSGGLYTLFTNPEAFDPVELEASFRHTAFQVVSILTTTGFSTKDINSPIFPALSRQLFLVMMVIGGCVGSTSGGFKVLRVAILSKLMSTELFKLRVSRQTSSELVIDNRIIPDDEIRAVSALFFSWITLLIVGGGITALFSSQGVIESLSGMCSALGNIGPCYISADNMINMHPVIKLTYIVGMLAGRLEILPVLLLMSWKAWR
ncbi:MAG: TrkH family potassium uptake protein [Kiritimatiellae bacterium]|nr:TrkH family potassium uptake protein [Kiritimatiellia bacterium]